jgi:nucleoside-diphosphate-sugar epimerase
MERDSKHMLGVATNLVAAAVVVETKSIVCWYWYFQQLQVAYLKYYESKVLMLNSDKSKKTLNWRPKYNLEESIKLISFWHKEFLAKKNILKISQKQILDYFK